MQRFRSFVMAVMAALAIVVPLEAFAAAPSGTTMLMSTPPGGSGLAPDGFSLARVKIGSASASTPAVAGGGITFSRSR